MRTVIMAVAALVLLGIGAAGGFFYGQTVGQAQANDIRSNFLQSRGINPGGQGGAAAQAGGFGGQAGGQGGGFAGQGGQGRGTFGSIKDVSGNTINLSTANAAVKVTITDQTTIQRTVQETVKPSDLQSGENIVVTGDQDSQGNITARSINIVPQGGGFGGRQGANASGTPGAAGTPGVGGPSGQGGNRGGGRQGAGANATPGAGGGQAGQNSQGAQPTAAP